jgi:endonuclease YncB( thermonuclease family)
MFEYHPEPFATPLLRAFVRKITDGDTFRLHVSMPFGLAYTGNFRLHGIDTSEIFSPKDAAEKADGLLAKAFVQDRLAIANNAVMIRTRRDDETFGRWVAEVFYYDETGTLCSLADALRAAGFEKKTRRAA